MINMPPDNSISELPHKRMEAWRWSDVRSGTRPGTNGLSTGFEPDIELPREIISSYGYRPGRDSVMGKLAARFTEKVLLLELRDGIKASAPLVLRFDGFGHSRILIRMGAGAELQVHEIYENNSAGFANIDIGFDLAKGAKLERTVLQNGHKDSTIIVTAHIASWAGCEINQQVLGFGAALARLETRLALMGEKVKLDMSAASLPAGARHIDQTSYVDFGAPDCQVRQSVKSVVSDNSRAVFQGKFHVRRPAQLTNANMRHDAIMLSDSAELRARPELEIYADDVVCAHGNTIGSLDESALFYMRQRGIPAAQARMILLKSFIMEGFKANKGFMDKISDWLERNI